MSSKFLCNANRKLRYILLSALAIAFIGLAAMAVTTVSTVPPDINEFILFAEEEIVLAQGSQVSSGNLGTNGELEIDKNSLISADLFADELSLAAGVQVDGNISFNELDADPKAVILGTTTTPVTIPIAILPVVPDFDPGTQDSTFSGSGNILAAGSYNNIKLKKGGKLTLSGGAYNLSNLELEKSSTLIFAAPTVLNIKKELEGHKNVAVLPGPDLKPDDLVINYEGDETDFGKDSFLNFKLLAPEAKVKIDKGITLKGQILARKVEVDKDVVLSRDETFFFVTPEENIIEDVEGAVYPVNEILLDLAEGTSLTDAIEIATLVDSRVVGNVSSFDFYQIIVPSTSETDLTNIVATLNNLAEPRLDGAFRNYVLELFGQFDLENLRNQDNLYTRAYDLISVREAWSEILTSSPILNDVKIGIVDTGVETTHPEFNDPAVNLGTNIGFLKTIMDPYKNGNGQGHGTQVAGIIGAGNVSDSPTSSLFPLSSSSPQMNGLLSGILDESQYVLEVVPFSIAGKIVSSTGVLNFKALETVLENSPHIVNLSYGNSRCTAFPGGNCIKNDDYAKLLGGYLSIFGKHSNVLFVAAAGNANIDVADVLPAGLGDLDNVITVGATDLFEKRAIWNPGIESNFGDIVAIAAPGSNVYAPKPNDEYVAPFLSGQGVVIGGFDGTSASAPMVTGMAGILKAINNTLSPTSIKSILTTTADPITTTLPGELPDKTLGSDCDDGNPNFRGCRLNALNAVNRALPVEIASISPNSGQQGETLNNVTITGKHFSPNVMTLEFSGSGINVVPGSVNVTSSTTLTAAINIDQSATLGTRDLTATKDNPAGSDTTKVGIFTVEQGTVPCVSPPAGLVSWWPGEGNALDIADGNDGLLQNGTSFVSGHVGQAFSFDGLDDFVAVGSNVNFDNEISIDAWVNVTGLTGDYQFVFYNSASVGEAILAVQNDLRGHMAVKLTNSTWYAAISSSTLNLNTWYHLAGTYDSSLGKLRIYVNGALENETITPTLPLFHVAGFPSSIGVFAQNTTGLPRFFKGRIDEVDVFSSALDAAEIQSIFSAGSGGKCSLPCVPPPTELVTWFPGDDFTDVITGQTGNAIGTIEFATGKVGQAFKFNGPTDAGDITLDISALGITDEFTLDAWVSHASTSTPIQRYISLVGNGTDTAIRFDAFNPGGPLDFFAFTTAGFKRLVNPLPSGLNQFFHIAGVFDGPTGKMELYINGQLSSSLSFPPGTQLGTISGGTPTSPPTVFISSQAFVNGETMNGLIDEAQIYDRALSASEIQSIVNAGASGHCQPVSKIGVTTSGRIDGPEEFVLFQNYPNPFNPSTIIHFSVPVTSSVSLKIYNLSGQLIATLHSGHTKSGKHKIVWNGTDSSGHRVGSGVYLAVMRAGKFVQARKMTLLR